MMRRPPRSTLFPYPTLSRSNYQVGVWIRSAGVTADTYDNVGSTRSVPFAIASSSPAAALTLTSLTADKSAPQPPGTTITWTATATRHRAPYSLKGGLPGRHTLTEAQPCSTHNTHPWTP